MFVDSNIHKAFLFLTIICRNCKLFRIYSSRPYFKSAVLIIKNDCFIQVYNVSIYSHTPICQIPNDMYR